MERRQFLSAAGSTLAAMIAGACAPRGLAETAGPSRYGPLRADPDALLDLPEGFSYRVISKLGEAMTDGNQVPDRADGMGCFDLGQGQIALVRNHELKPKHDGGGLLSDGYDVTSDGTVLPGGTTTIVLDAATLDVIGQHRSLAGTIRNCAGGATPWGTWLTCEEDVTRAGDKVRRDHGWVFEVPAAATGLVRARPLTGLGRFYHEAAVVDPASGMVYMTEDREDGLFYRFVPDVPGDLARGGKLQALAVDGLADARNWSEPHARVGTLTALRWIDLDGIENPLDDLRQRGAAQGATLFARGEGITVGQGELFFCCTSGGAARLGQVFRLDTGTDRLSLFFESTSPDQLNYGDNLALAPNGHLIVCEDQYTKVVDNHLRGIAPDGGAYALARLRVQTELAGACFSPDGKVLFVNVYSPTRTLAITGPWAA